MLEKEVVIGETTYKIRKMTPQVACYWAFKIFGSVITAKGFAPEEILNEVQKFIMGIDKKEFEILQKDCLIKVVWKSPNGTFPVMNPGGELTVTELNAAQVMLLTVQSFIYSISDFFDQSLLAALPGGDMLVEMLFEPTSPNTSESMSSSSPQSSTDTGDNTNSGMEPTP